MLNQSVARVESIPLTLPGLVSLPETLHSDASLRRDLGDTGLRVHPIALGTSVFGWTAQTSDCELILDRYAEQGGNFLDTADSYSAGRSEHIIGQWMSRRGNRDRMVVSTKVGRHPDNPGLGSVSVVRAVEASLERLQTDHIDVLYFHDDDPSVPLEDALGTAEWLIETGKIRHLAVSGYRPERLVQARILAASGYPRIAAVGTHYSLLHRSSYEGSLELVSRGQHLAVLPYLTLENGFLSGKYRSRAQLDTSARGTRVSSLVNRQGLRALQVLDRVAEEQEQSPTSVALAWVLSRPGITAPVVSANDPEQVDALMAAPNIELTRTQRADLEKVWHS
ncbi:aldo/keto reductase [Mycetocola tolaasinivorans]|uniref:Aldo/keto reductase n=1 Tax=Mycetocola tolaasinivorans TaxID=76635 RepID=A0A3L7AEE3_9MICO|nr:aldo/keto reductase [Mycetocola tolaasinivorans]RLP77762.1 aldo/keto reductase [Mycetocola tolaasinivorans]